MAAAVLLLCDADPRPVAPARAALLHPLRPLDADPAAPFQRVAAGAAVQAPALPLREQLQRREGGVHRCLLAHPDAWDDPPLGQLLRVPQAAADGAVQG